MNTILEKQNIQGNRKYKDSSIMLAIDECIDEGVLEDILTKQRNEVFSVILSTFDKELYEKDLKEEAYEEGYDAGYDKGAYDKLCKLIRNKLKKGKSVEQIADELEETVEAINEIMKEIENSEE